MAAIKDQFNALTRSASDLGVPLREVEEAKKRASIQAWQEVYDAKQRVMVDIQAFGGGGDTLQGEQEAIRRRFLELQELAQDYGIGMHGLLDAFHNAAQNAIEAARDRADDLQRQVAQQVRGIGEIFVGYIEPLQALVANQNSRLSPLGQISRAREDFRQTLGLAETGDVAALRRLPQVAQALQGLSSQFLGSGGLGAEIAREIEGGATGLIADLQRQQAETLASLPQVQRETVAEQIRQAKADTAEIVEELRRLRSELANLRPAA